VGDYGDPNDRHRISLPAGLWPWDPTVNPIEFLEDIVVRVNGYGTVLNPTAGTTSDRFVKTYSGSSPSATLGDRINPSIIEGLTIYGPEDGSVSAQYAIDIQSPRFTLKKVNVEHINGGVDDGLVRVLDSYDAVLQGCEFTAHQNIGHSLIIDGQSNNVVVRDGVLAFASETCALIRESAQGILFDNVDFGGQTTHGLHSEGASEDGPIKVRDCYFEQISGAHIKAESTTADVPNGFIIEDNHHGFAGVQPDYYIQIAGTDGVKIDGGFVPDGESASVLAIEVDGSTEGVAKNIETYINSGGINSGGSPNLYFRFDVGIKDLNAYSPDPSVHIDAVNFNSNFGSGRGRYESIAGASTWTKL